MAKKQKATKNLLEVQNAAKTLFANIRFQSIDDPITTIALTSSVPDEGKTTTAWYLAQAAATAGNEVLLIEGDMRRRSLASMLQIHPKDGLFAVLTGRTRLEQAMARTAVNGLYFLDAEPSIPNPPDLLASKRMRQLNEALKKQFDYVIYDTPPVGTFVDAAVLGTIVDGMVLVVRPGTPKRTELQLAYEQLESAGANVIGLCSTFVEGTGSDYYYSYYTKGQKRREDLAFTDNMSLDDGQALMASVDLNGSSHAAPAGTAGSAAAAAKAAANATATKTATKSAVRPAQQAQQVGQVQQAGQQAQSTQAQYGTVGATKSAAGKGISVPREARHQSQKLPRP